MSQLESSTSIESLRDGQWVEVQDNGLQTLVCCDCGLTHQLEFKIVDGRIRWRAYRDEDMTAEVRAEDAMKQSLVNETETI